MSKIINEFRGDKDPFTLNFEFTDIVTGLSYIEFKGSTIHSTTTRTRVLVTNTLDPGNDPDKTTVQDTDRRTRVTGTEKFFTSYPFKKAYTMEGNAYIVLTIEGTSTFAGTPVYTITIYKNDIVLATDTWTYVGGANQQTATLELTIPKTSFNIDDTLKFGISESGSSAGTSYIQHDPLNRDVSVYTPPGGLGEHGGLTATTNPTKLSVFIPIKATV